MFDRSRAAAERAVELNGGGSLSHLSLDEFVVAFEGGELRAQNVPKVLAPPSYSPTAVFWLRRAWESAVAIATARRSSPYFVP